MTAPGAFRHLFLMSPGQRVTWFSDADLWGSVVADDGSAQVTIRWDGSEELSAVDRGRLTARGRRPHPADVCGCGAAWHERHAPDCPERET